MVRGWVGDTSARRGTCQGFGLWFGVGLGIHLLGEVPAKGSGYGSGLGWGYICSERYLPRVRVMVRGWVGDTSARRGPCQGFGFWFGVGLGIHLLGEVPA